MPYTPTTIDDFRRRLSIFEDIRDNVLIPLRDTHGIFTHVALGVPHLERESLTSVVRPSQYPAAFTDELPGDTSHGTTSTHGHRASGKHRITNLTAGVWVIDKLGPSDVVAQKVVDLLEPVVDLMRADPKRGGVALTTELSTDGHTQRILGDTIVLGVAFDVPYQWRASQ